MGLTLHFEFRLPGTHSPERVEEKLGKLREFALTTRADFVTPILFIAAERPTTPQHDNGIELARLFDVWVEVMSDVSHDGSHTAFQYDPDSTLGFAVNPGEGCEPALFGFVRRHDPSKGLDEWFWQNSCKTQFASAESEEHFVACHTRLVTILDHAIALGIDVTVFDEGEYWDSRDVSVLLKELRKMNHIVAMVAGKISDAGHDVKSPIFEYRNFERLEMGEAGSE